MITSPRDIPDLYIWLDADERVQINDVNEVVEWQDNSTVGPPDISLGAVVSFNPLWIANEFSNGKSAIYGDGTDILMATTDSGDPVLPSVQSTLFMLVKAGHVCDTGGDCNPVVVMGGDENVQNSFFQVWNDVTVEVAGVTRNSPRRFWDHPFSTTEYKIYSFRKSGSYVRNINMWENGVLRAEDFQYDALAETQGSAFSLFGTYRGGEFHLTNNYIACLIYYRRSLTDEEMRDVEEWIHREYYEEHVHSITPDGIELYVVDVSSPTLGRGITPVAPDITIIGVEEPSMTKVDAGMGPIIVTVPTLYVDTGLVHLIVDDVSTPSLVAESPTLGKVYSMAPDDVGIASPGIEAPDMSVGRSADPDDVSTTPSVGSPSLSRVWSLAPDDVSATPSVDSPWVKAPSVAYPVYVRLQLVWVDRPSLLRFVDVSPEDVRIVRPFITRPSIKGKNKWRLLLPDDVTMSRPEVTSSTLILYIREHAFTPMPVQTQAIITMPGVSTPFVLMLVAAWVRATGVRVEEATARKTHHDIKPLEIRVRDVVIIETGIIRYILDPYEGICEESLEGYIPTPC